MQGHKINKKEWNCKLYTLF